MVRISLPFLGTLGTLATLTTLCAAAPAPVLAPAIPTPARAPALAGTKDAALHVGRPAEEDPAILAAYAANPRLDKIMYGGGGGGKTVAKRGDSGSGSASGGASDLCDPVTGADANDIKQTTLNDCWLASTMLTMAYVNPWWPISRFQTAGGQLHVDAATVLLTPPGGGAGGGTATFTHEFRTADLADPAVPYSVADAHWWPAAIEAAVWAYGNATGDTDILLDGGRPVDGLKMLTGYDADYTEPGTPVATLFARMQTAQKSPVLLTTVQAGTRTLQAWHIYAVLSAVTDSNGKMRVALRNPLVVGSGGEWHYLDDIYGDISNIVWLKGGQNGPPA